MRPKETLVVGEKSSPAGRRAFACTGEKRDPRGAWNATDYSAGDSREPRLDEGQSVAGIRPDRWAVRLAGTRGLVTDAAPPHLSRPTSSARDARPHHTGPSAGSTAERNDTAAIRRGTKTLRRAAGLDLPAARFDRDVVLTKRLGTI